MSFTNGDQSDLKENPHNANQDDENNDYVTSKSLKIRKSKLQKPISSISKKRSDVIKWNGWGYNDSKFIVKDGLFAFTGKRYPIGDVYLPYMTQWVKEVLNIDPSNMKAPEDKPPLDQLPKPILNEEFLDSIAKSSFDYSIDAFDRLIRSHGQTLNDIYVLRKKTEDISRIPDVVIWPVSHEEVITLVKLAIKHNVVIIPYGGGTSVSGAISCPENESRCIVALDTSQMNNILWLDEKNLLVCVQSGIIGQDLEEFLKEKGYTCGHEPDSYEFSTVGGWVATRASGMKKNIYGNIEDLLVGVQFVTPKGVLSKSGLNPRQSTGPDLNHIVLGSEGTLGVVTEVILKIRPLPEIKKYGSIVFPNFEAGVKFMREVARQKSLGERLQPISKECSMLTLAVKCPANRAYLIWEAGHMKGSQSQDWNSARCQPASVRLMDNEQFQFGQAIRPQSDSYWDSFMNSVKKCYLKNIKGFDLEMICVATLLFEGNKSSVEQQEKIIYKIAKDFGGLPAGEKNGECGYMLTFVIAYIRDMGLDMNIVAESFETSVPWDRTLALCKNVKYVINKMCQKFGIQYYLVSHRVTQTYDCGSCVYFYFAFNWEGLTDPLGAYSAIEEEARSEILRCGGSLSHHHGVGKLRAKWYPSQVSTLGANIYRNTKIYLDPKNIFGCGNLLPLKSNL